MSVTPMPLQSACWHYHIPYRNEKNLSPLSKDLCSCHIHLATFDLSDTFAIVSIRSGFSGVWDLMKSYPRRSTTTATIKFNEAKRITRSEFKSMSRDGMLVPANSCSHIRIGRSFEHFQNNQGMSLYDPVRDGYSQI